MAFYMVRHTSGEIYNNFDLPIEPDLSIETWKQLLKEELDSREIAVGDIRATQLSEQYGVKTTEGIIIDTGLPPSKQPSQLVTNAIAFIALTTPPNQ